MTSIAAKVDAFAKKVEGIAVSQHPQGYQADIPANLMVLDETEQANYLGNPARPQNNPYSNTYNPRWRNYPNFSWSNQQVQRGTAPAPGF